MNKQKLILTVSFVALVGVIYWGVKSNFTLPFAKPTSTEQLEEAKTKALAYIKNDLLKGQDIPVEITNITEKDGLYKLSLKIQDNPIEAYMTKDLTTFFPNPQDMAKSSPVAEKQTKEQVIPKSDKPQVELYVMSYCPYGNQAEEAMKPVVDLLGNNVDVAVRYILNDKGSGDTPEVRFASLHGPDEFKQDIREICIQNEQPAKFWEYLDAVNKDCTLDNIATCWKTVASKTGVNASQVSTCYNQNANDYGEQEAKAANENQVSGSPTLLINGTRYTGGRSPEDYKQAICGAFNDAPEECNTELGSTTSSAGGGCNN